MAMIKTARPILQPFREEDAKGNPIYKNTMQRAIPKKEWVPTGKHQKQCPHSVAHRRPSRMALYDRRLQQAQFLCIRQHYRTDSWSITLLRHPSPGAAGHVIRK